jgi:membrane protein DedA with SNARE-associated domain
MLGWSISSVTGKAASAVPVLFGLVLGDSAGLPIPRESSIMVAAIAASQGSLSISGVLALGIAAAILGDNLAIWAAARSDAGYGQRVGSGSSRAKHGCNVTER